MNYSSSIIEDVKKLLEYFQALGIDGLPVEFDNIDTSVIDREDRLNLLKQELGNCTRCKLSAHRSSIVFGEGDAQAKIMFIGEAPGREEDIQGVPFVGEAGALLTRLIEKMGMKRNEVYIANVIKCRPPMNRDPDYEEIETCRYFIEKQIEIISPEVVITLGRIAFQSIMRDQRLKITSARGNFFQYKNIPLMPTFHPAYLLRNPKHKWLTWNDVQKVLERIKIPEH
jgi:DNA polymerase